MRTIRYILIVLIALNCLAGISSVQAIGLSFQQQAVAPIAVLRIMFGYSIPLDMVSHFMEKYYPAASGAGGGREEKETRQHVSDMCVLVPGGVSRIFGSNGVACRIVMNIAPAIIPGSECLWQSFGCCLHRLRTCGSGYSLLLAYLVILSLANLPGDKCVNYVLSKCEKGSSGNGWAFSFGIAL